MINSYKKYISFFVFLLVVVGIFFIINRSRDSVTTPLSTYRELITAGHKLYLQEKYEEALPYFKKAVLLEQSDRIYRSLYSVYLGLKDYKNAEIYIKKSVGINGEIPNNWLEYASFENYYMKAPFDVVSQVYLKGLEVTKNNIDLVTNYAGYLTENKKYNEAIVYLKKAIAIDPTRKDAFQAEINSLQKGL